MSGLRLEPLICLGFVLCMGKDGVKCIHLHLDVQFPQHHLIEAVFLPTSALGIFVQGVVCVWVLGIYVLGICIRCCMCVGYIVIYSIPLVHVAGFFLFLFSFGAISMLFLLLWLCNII